MKIKENEKLGLGSCVTILVGGCIGSAIFSLSGMTMYYAGPAALITWFVAALILGLYGIQVAELSIRYPKSGGVFVFPAKAMGKNEREGKVWGFISAWGYVISNIIAVAFSAIYVAVYLGVGFQALAGFRIPLAIISIVICTALNLIKVTSAGKYNNVLVALLVITMLTFVSIAMFAGKWNPQNMVPFFTQGAKGVAGFIQAIPNAMVGYGSVVAIAFMVGEVENPNRTVPKSLAISLILVVLLYQLMILGTMGNITTEFLIKNPGMRFIPMFAAAFTSLNMFPWLSKLISISALLALLTTMLVVGFLNARAVCSMANAKMLPAFFGKVNKNGVPSTACLTLSACTIVLSCFPSITELLVNLGSISAAITIVIVCFSLIASRKKLPHVEGNYAAPGGNIVSILTIILILICYIPAIFNGSVYMWLFTFILYAIGGIIMFIMMKKNKAD